MDGRFSLLPFGRSLGFPLKPKYPKLSQAYPKIFGISLGYSLLAGEGKFPSDGPFHYFRMKTT